MEIGQRLGAEKLFRDLKLGKGVARVKSDPKWGRESDLKFAFSLILSLLVLALFPPFSLSSRLFDGAFW